MTITLSPEAIEAYKTLMTEPKTYGLNFEPLDQVFEVAEIAIAKHVLYEEYLVRIDKTRDQLPKVFFYIIMDEKYNVQKAADGNLGYCVRFSESSQVA